MVGPEPAVDRRIGLLGEIADCDPHRDAVRRRNVREKHRERVEAGHKSNAKTAGSRKQRFR